MQGKCMSQRTHTDKLVDLPGVKRLIGKVVDPDFRGIVGMKVRIEVGGGAWGCACEGAVGPRLWKAVAPRLRSIVSFGDS